MPGKTNPADVLSRLPISAQPTRERSVAEEYINFITEKQFLKPLHWNKYPRRLKMMLSCNWFSNVYCTTIGQTTLTFSDLLKCEMSCQQAKACCFGELALSCLNACATKPFPWLTKATKALCSLNNSSVRRCGGQESMLKQRPSSRHAYPVSTMPPTVPEPLRPSTMPSKPWQSIHIDLCGPFPSGESLLVCVDACSRWPEVEIIRATSSEVIIRRLQKIFATHGLPEQVTSDNCSNLVSREIEDFFSSHGIYHRKVYWPQANATVKRFNGTVEKAIRTAHVEGRD
jgi:hypothetical protein